MLKKILIRLTLLYWPESYKAWTLEALMSKIARAFVVFKDLSNLSSWVVMVAMLNTFLKKDTTFWKTSELFEVPIANDWIYQNDCLDYQTYVYDELYYHKLEFFIYSLSIFILRVEYDDYSILFWSYIIKCKCINYWTLQSILTVLVHCMINESWETNKETLVVYLRQPKGYLIVIKIEWKIELGRDHKQFVVVICRKLHSDATHRTIISFIHKLLTTNHIIFN